MLRLQKFLAESGIASRRASEQLIREGRVAVNGVVITQLGTKVDPTHEKVTVDGRLVRARRKLYIALNKPTGYFCTRDDPAGRPMVGQLLPKEWQHLHLVGRLDADSQGLIFLTNDGQFSLRVMHPRYGTSKIYHVTLGGRVDPAVLAHMKRGVVDRGEQLRVHQARLLSVSNKQSILQLELRQGKYREIRRLCSVLGLEVLKLKRLQIGPIKLGELPEGKWRTLTEPEIKSLLGPL